MLFFPLRILQPETQSHCCRDELLLRHQVWSHLVWSHLFGAICVTVDVVVHRFDFFVIFICWDSHNKFRVEVISCRHTVLILFAQWNGVEDSVKDFCVASKVTSGVDHRRTDPVSIGLECLSVPPPRSSCQSV